MEYQDTKINLVINKLTKQQFVEAQLSGLINEQELYLVIDDVPIENVLSVDPYNASTYDIAIVLNQILAKLKQ